ncbi:MAG: hypothetical protein LUO84_04640 [Methanomassiliicoccales archaeon]|nr:hypothetical protein [Methanomassiliicoccales archaeon]
MSDDAEGQHIRAHREFFRSVLEGVYKVMAERFRLSDVTIRPIGSGGSRLSIPVVIQGSNEKGQKVRYFGKIMGSSDLLTARTIQFFKNVFLQVNSMDPMFEVTKSAEDMARHQHEMLVAINKLGIPTAKPYGFYPLNADIWLLVAEYLDAHPISSIEDLSSENLDAVFGYLKRMHDNDIFHGDIKPDNLMFGDVVYIVDVGHFMKDVPTAQKKAYDLACQIASFLEYLPPGEIISIARRHYSGKELRAAADYIDLVQSRMDINFDDETKKSLLRLMRSKIGLRGSKKNLGRS